MTYIKKLGKLSVKTWLTSLAVMVLSLLALVLAQSVRSSLFTVKSINERYQSTDSTLNRLTSNDQLFEMIKWNTYQQARLNLIKKDSISMCINLSDSTLTLVIRGVPVHRNRIDGYTYSPILDKINRTALINLFSEPNRIVNDTSNIVKHPIRKVIAPKNEEEAAKLSGLSEIDTLMETAALRFQLDNDLVIVVEHKPEALSIPSKSYKKFISAFDRKTKWDYMNNIFSTGNKEQQIWIRIYLPPEESKSIYRALPDNAYVAIHI